jgi:hypothetical protein
MFFEIFKGQLSYAVTHELSKWFYDKKRKELRICAIDAFRYTFKFLYESIVLQEENRSYNLLFEQLNELFNHWTVIVDPAYQLALDPTEPTNKLRSALSSGTRGIFIVGLKSSGAPLNIKIITRNNNCKVKVGELNIEAIRVKFYLKREYGPTNYWNCFT